MPTAAHELDSVTMAKSLGHAEAVAAVMAAKMDGCSMCGRSAVAKAMVAAVMAARVVACGISE